MAKNSKLNITAAEFYKNLHNHQYKFPEQHRSILLSMLVTAAENLDKKKIQVTIAEKNKYLKAKKECRLRGIQVESHSIGASDYEYRAVIRPHILLRQANNFKITAGENSPAASIKLYFER